MGVEVRAIDGAVFGGIVTGVDASQIGDAVAGQLRAASRNHHGVLCFRFDELLTVDELNALTAVFGEWEWHSDMSYISAPPTFSLLHSRRVLAEGGDTGFCSQILAARTLPRSDLCGGHKPVVRQLSRSEDAR